MPELPEPRWAGGLWCTDVLERLEAYVAGRLAPAEQAQVDDHLRACDQCARFGGAYQAVVVALRRSLGAPEELEDERAARLEARLQQLAGG